MAIAARQVQVAVGDDHAVAIEREIIVDRERGIVAEVENTAVAVDLGNGKVRVETRQKVVGVHVGDLTNPAPPQYRQVRFSIYSVYANIYNGKLHLNSVCFLN